MSRYQRVRELGKKGYVQLVTTQGNLNIEVGWPVLARRGVSLIARAVYAFRAGAHTGCGWLGSVCRGLEFGVYLCV